MTKKILVIGCGNIGSRQNGRDRGKNVIDIRYHNSELIQKSIIRALNMKKTAKNHKNVYGNGNASKKIVAILEKIKLDKKLIQKQLSY